MTPSPELLGSLVPKAEIKTEAKGSDSGLVAVYVTAGTFFGGSITFGLLYTGTALLWIPPVGIVTSILMAAVGTLGWYKSRLHRNQAETPPTVFQVSRDTAMLTTAAISSADDLKKLMPMLLQHRKKLPPPHGSVTGNPKDDSGLKVYDEVERANVSRAIEQKEAAHDRLLGAAFGLGAPAIPEPQKKKA
jgi:hypothetical protein